MKKKRLIRMSSFVLPIAIVLVLMAVLRVYPFGDNTFLIWDMDWQYSSFFAHLHDILHGNASPWYSFSRAIGGDMVGVSAYYLISPFNLLFYFFDAEHIYAGIALVLTGLPVQASNPQAFWQTTSIHSTAFRTILITSRRAATRYRITA